MVLHDAHVIQRIEHREHEQAWKILNLIEKCSRDIAYWEEKKRDAKTSTDAIIAIEELKTLRGSRDQLNREFLGDLQAAPAIGTELSAPVVMADMATTAPVAPSASDTPAWAVTRPQRYKGYATPLHRLLVAAHREGKPRLSARDVVEEWRINKPAEVAQVLSNGFDYYDAQGNTQHADLEAIRKAIGRMTSTR